ncbi:MAG: hypothetical protein A2161_16180 [Candidatus Schekmanbacteria bacterium RBG_13_48_7]|uniref:Flagellar hook-length control protein-like C-terminal domain-containing protein n=1 Tax=Candidatus Schekmanbacteria bacterium RBG_13_48_7 TaxID=1817878 RepID=A0A1F7RT19_9BACT|nr:MAG: hypothetical protein A2161_16180 [Candidatus Schekmanbacteria bacterium RBG_13_48_7]
MEQEIKISILQTFENNPHKIISSSHNLNERNQTFQNVLSSFDLDENENQTDSQTSDPGKNLKNQKNKLIFDSVNNNRFSEKDSGNHKSVLIYPVSKENIRENHSEEGKIIQLNNSQKSDDLPSDYYSDCETPDDNILLIFESENLNNASNKVEDGAAEENNLITDFADLNKYKVYDSNMTFVNAEIESNNVSRDTKTSRNINSFAELSLTNESAMENWHNKNQIPGFISDQPENLSVKVESNETSESAYARDMVISRIVNPPALEFFQESSSEPSLHRDSNNTLVEIVQESANTRNNQISDTNTTEMEKTIQNKDAGLNVDGLTVEKNQETKFNILLDRNFITETDSSNSNNKLTDKNKSSRSTDVNYGTNKTEVYPGFLNVKGKTSQEISSQNGIFHSDIKEFINFRNNTNPNDRITELHEQQIFAKTTDNKNSINNDVISVPYKQSAEIETEFQFNGMHKLDSRLIEQTLQNEQELFLKNFIFSTENVETESNSKSETNIGIGNKDSVRDQNESITDNMNLKAVPEKQPEKFNTGNAFTLKQFSSLFQKLMGEGSLLTAGKGLNGESNESFPWLTDETVRKDQKLSALTESGMPTGNDGKTIFDAIKVKTIVYNLEGLQPGNENKNQISETKPDITLKTGSESNPLNANEKIQSHIDRSMFLKESLPLKPLSQVTRNFNNEIINEDGTIVHNAKPSNVPAGTFHRLHSEKGSEHDKAISETEPANSSSKTSPKTFPENETNVKNSDKFNIHELMKNPVNMPVGNSDSSTLKLNNLMETTQADSKIVKEMITSELLNRFPEILTNNKKEIVISLEPETLGKLKIFMEIKNNELVARIQTEHWTVKDLINSELPKLKEWFSQQDIQVKEFVVDINYSHDQHGHPTNNHSWEQNKNKSNESMPGLGDSTFFEQKPEPGTSHIDGSNLVNLVV